jgi:uncharacterized membrane protein HdeD (DUF308 family)
MQTQSLANTNWLRSYYFTRALFSILWIIVAVLAGSANTLLASVLLIIYPAWDALANLVDARSNGGMKANPSQALNVFVSVLTTLAVVFAVTKDMYAVLAVFGVWATLSGILQLSTGVRRWRSVGAQWVMILSGGQSALVGAVMIKQALGTVPPSIFDIAPYVGFGAFYFLLSAIWLSVADYRKQAFKG